MSKNLFRTRALSPLEEACNVVRDSQMLIGGNFLLASGAHTNIKAEFDRVREKPHLLIMAARLMLQQYQQDSMRRHGQVVMPDVLIATPNGANALTEHLARLMSMVGQTTVSVLYCSVRPNREFLVIDSTKQLQALEGRNGETLTAVKVDDVRTTGQSANRAFTAVRKSARDNFDVELVPLASLAFAARQGPIGLVGSNEPSSLAAIYLPLTSSEDEPEQTGPALAVAGSTLYRLRTIYNLPSEEVERILASAYTQPEQLAEPTVLPYR